jgi:glycosidase
MVMDTPRISRQTRQALERLLPGLETKYAAFVQTHPVEWQAFTDRLQQHFPRLFDRLLKLYGNRYDFYYHMQRLLEIMVEAWIERPATLRDLDAQRDQNPRWFQSNQMLGGVCYVDLFASDLQGLQEKIPYFKELGLTYLHLMPLFKCPPGENDGGYAVSSYRETNPALGSVEQLRDLAEALRQAGICLVLDFILNHTADDHAWAQRARQGDLDYQEYYFIFPDRQMPDLYEQHLREIFPDEHPGAFSPLTFAGEDGQSENGWVWTTFHKYQWDLNYTNLSTFNQMAAEMLFLANLGADVLRLDALAFTWKKPGTVCESLPEAHWLIQAFNAVTRIASPSLLFKSEAIVHPNDVAKYISTEECQVSYNPLLMAMLWNTLATRQVDLLGQALRNRFRIDPGCAWVNYMRCHDDIGWTFSDEDAAQMGYKGFDHRQFLNAFYTGRFTGSFGRGLPFQENPKTGDCRISGTCASLAGLEKALKEETEVEVGLAVRRILLIHAIILTIGGIPLIYLGDEIGTLNDYRFRNDPNKAHDSRWVHRPFADAARYARRNTPATVEGQIYQGLQRLIALRKSQAIFSGNEMDVIDTGNAHVLGYTRRHGLERALVFANFSEQAQTIPANLLRLYGLNSAFTNLLTGETAADADLVLESCGFVCLKET